jgi:hypothetical protein
MSDLEKEVDTLINLVISLHKRVVELQEEQATTSQLLLQLIAMHAKQHKPANMGPSRPLSEEQIAGLEDVFEGFAERYRARGQCDRPS